MMRYVNFIAMILLGLLWAGLLVIGGALAAIERPHWLPGPRSVLVGGGITAMLAGQFVFLVVVADRLFPRRPALIAMGVEGALAALLLVSFATTIVLALGDPS